MATTIQPMTAQDVDALLKLWHRTEGLGLDDVSDSPEAVGAYLRRNPTTSFVARSEDGKLIGGCLCGHDGRRGYLHHVVVDPGWRRQGIGAEIVLHCLRALAAAGIVKCHAFVFATNDNALRMYEKTGWTLRDDLQVISHATPGGEKPASS